MQKLNKYDRSCGTMFRPTAISTLLCINLENFFAGIYPPLGPEFLYHFSNLAQKAIAEDIRQGRQAYLIGGVMQADLDELAGDPFIMPWNAIVHNSKDVFRRALCKD